MPLPDSEFEQFLEISVTDTGIGIELASMDRLFTPFSQIPNALTRSIEGTGWAWSWCIAWRNCTVAPCR
jgi:signal transduction histidine kinase